MRQIVAFACNQDNQLVICDACLVTVSTSNASYIQRLLGPHLPARRLRYANPLQNCLSMPKASPASEALNWLSRILAIGLVMLGSGWLGGQVDRFLKTQFFTVIGFLIGMSIGLVALIGILKRSNNNPQPR